MKKKKSLLLAFTVFSTFVFAQPSNSIRTNLTMGLAIGDYNATYEKKFTDKISLSTRTNFMSFKGIPFGNITGLYASTDSLPNLKSNLRDLKITAGGARPEIRFHRKGGGLSGGYIGIYTTAQFGKSSEIISSYKRTNSNNQEVVSDLMFTPSFSYFGGGLSLGKQWVLGPGITIDITWISLGVGVTKIKTTASASDMTEMDYKQYADDFNASAVSVGNVGPKATYDSEGVSVSVSQIGFVPRILQFGIGFSF